MLEFSWPAFGFAIVNFLVLMGLLWKFLHKPLLATLDKREEAIKTERELALSETQKATQAKEEYEAKLKNASIECDALLTAARQSAEESKEKLLAAATEEAHRLSESIKQADEREIRDRQSELQQAIASTTLSVVGSVLAKVSDGDIEDKLNAQLNQQLAELKVSDESVVTIGDSHVSVTSARELDSPQKDKLLKSLVELGCKDQQVQFAVDEALLAGTRVEFSDRSIDASLADVLVRIKESLDSRSAAPVGESAS